MRRRLPENDLKPWRKDMWYIPQVDGECVARMEDVLDLYAEAPDPKRPVVCFDESPMQLIGETRQPIPPSPAGSNVTITSIAAMARSISSAIFDVYYPDAETIRVVQDNLSTHSAGALYRAFPPAEARRILRRLEFHYTPKHASWLNMVEIEIGVLRGQCLDRRIDDPKRRLRREIAAWERSRNAARSRIKWMFTTDKARAKMGRAYPKTSKES
jgi:DDE superfamily endonuclease